MTDCELTVKRTCLVVLFLCSSVRSFGRRVVSSRQLLSSSWIQFIRAMSSSLVSLNQ